MTMKNQSEENLHLVYESLRANEWACYMCLFLSVLMKWKKPEPISHNPLLKDISWNKPLPFDGSTQEHIFFTSLINYNLCPNPNNAYKYFFHLSKAIKMKFDTVRQWQLEEFPIETLWYTKKEIEKQWYTEKNEWNIIFDRLLDETILKEKSLPMLSLKTITPPKAEILEIVIDEYIRLFMEWKWSPKDLMPYQKLRNTIFQKISEAYEIMGVDIFHIQEKTFDRYKGFSLTYAIAMLWRLGYIEILDIQTVTEEWVQSIPSKYSKEKGGVYLDIDEAETERLRGLFKEKRMINHIFQIKLTEKFKEVLKGFWEIRDIILDKIFDEEYKKISLTRKWWAFYMLEGELEIETEGTKFVDLQKKYPYSEISTDNHWGKAKKYIVKEKIKLDNESNKNKQ